MMVFDSANVFRKHEGKVKLESNEVDEFIIQYRSALEETKGICGVVYVLRTLKPIPRFRGSSNILYIGETKHDVWSRYDVDVDTRDFWSVYSHAVASYGHIEIDVYESEDHKTTEKEFLAQYFASHGELPPINRRF
ncbi:hypothetical protein [Microbulbifer hainanensis]|uniref:hypothetical protein n=1 Tax=Microbulbifer hainanensis TaxID=2735675 RepID=UPI0018665436|nr:hypothetical protein [Microbulbifer hainanensis]